MERPPWVYQIAVQRPVWSTILEHFHLLRYKFRNRNTLFAPCAFDLIPVSLGLKVECLVVNHVFMFLSNDRLTTVIRTSGSYSRPHRSYLAAFSTLEPFSRFKLV